LIGKYPYLAWFRRRDIMSFLSVELGCDVLTAYGWGVVRSASRLGTSADMKYVVELDGWDMANASTARLYCTNAGIIRSSMYDVGSCVMTKYGSGVLLQYRRVDDLFVVRLWQPFGEGSATAYMTRTDIMCKIAASTGNRVSTPLGEGFVSAVLPRGVESGQTLYIYNISLHYGTAFMNAQSIKCKEASVVPAADYLTSQMSRSSRLMQGVQERYGSGAVAALEPLRQSWEKISKGGSSITDILKERSRQLQDKLRGLDAKSLEERLRDRVAQEVADREHIESLLAEGKRRVAELIESAEKRDELTQDTRSTLQGYLKLGMSQVDGAVARLQEEASDEEKLLLAEVVHAKEDLEKSLTVMKDIARSDPVLKEIYEKIGDVSARAKSRTHDIEEELKQTAAVQTLSEGAQVFTQKLDAILVTPESSRLKELGSRVLSSIGKQGEEKGRELFDGVKSRVLSKLAQEEHNSSVMQSVEARIMEELNKWKQGQYQDVSSKVNESLSTVSFLLGVISEGSAQAPSSKEVLSAALSRSSISRDFAASPKAFMWRKLLASLVAMKEKEEEMKGFVMTGEEFVRQFRVPPDVAARRALSTYAQPRVAQLTKFIDSKLDPKYADAAAPITALVNDIASGRFDLDVAVKAAKDSLNSKGMALVAAEMLKQGDKVVGALEAFSSSDTVQLAMIRLQDMDIESTLGDTIKKFDSNKALNLAEGVLTNAEARTQLVNETKDRVLEFLLENLPTMTVPDIQGVKDDVQFAITGLDMSGFKLRKEDVKVDVGSSLKEELFSCTAVGIGAKFARVKWKYEQLYFPYLSGSGLADANVINASVRLGLKLVRVPKGLVRAVRGSSTDMIAAPTVEDEAAFYRMFPKLRGPVEAIRNGIPDLADAQRQIAGGRSPSASAAASNNAAVAAAGIWSDYSDWEPVLVLSSKVIAMESLQLNIEDSSLSWLYNLLASVFSGLIREYVCTSLRDVVSAHSAMLLGSVNSVASKNWAAIKQIVGADISALPMASMADIAALMGPPIVERPVEIIAREYKLKFAEPGSIGLKMNIFKAEHPPGQAVASSPPAKVGCRVHISGTMSGSPAEKALRERGLLGYHMNAKILSVNAKPVQSMQEEELLQYLKSVRPLFLTVRLERGAWEALGQDKQRTRAIESSNVSPTAGSTSAPATGSGAAQGSSLDGVRTYHRGDTKILSAVALARSNQQLAVGKRKLRIVTLDFHEGPLGE
jgi:hypothetical protein